MLDLSTGRNEMPVSYWICIPEGSTPFNTMHLYVYHATTIAACYRQSVTCSLANPGRFAAELQ